MIHGIECMHHGKLVVLSIDGMNDILAIMN